HANPVYVGGRIKGVEPPSHYDFKTRRHTPAALRAEFERLGWRRIAAFHTRSPMLQMHQSVATRAAQQAEANLLIQPVVDGEPYPGEIDQFTRARCYERALEEFPQQTTFLSLMPFAPRLAGPREAVWHMI